MLRVGFVDFVPDALAGEYDERVSYYPRNRQEWRVVEVEQVHLQRVFPVSYPCQENLHNSQGVYGVGDGGAEHEVANFGFPGDVHAF